MGYASTLKMTRFRTSTSLVFVNRNIRYDFCSLTRFYYYETELKICINKEIASMFRLDYVFAARLKKLLY